MIVISLVYDRTWSYTISNDLIAIKRWSRQALPSWHPVVGKLWTWTLFCTASISIFISCLCATQVTAKRKPGRPRVNPEKVIVWVRYCESNFQFLDLQNSDVDFLDILYTYLKPACKMGLLWSIVYVKMLHTIIMTVIQVSLDQPIAAQSWVIITSAIATL